MADAATEESTSDPTAVKSAASEEEEEEEDLFETDDEPTQQPVATDSKESSGKEDPQLDEAPTNMQPPAPVATDVEAAPTDVEAAPIPRIPRIPRIPTKSKSNTVESAAQPPAQSETTSHSITTIGATQFGLPEGVRIPASVKASLLQGRLLETLRSLPTQLINDSLAEYDDAVQIKGDAIRNHGAYLFGVIKRYVSVQERASTGDGQGVLPMGPELTPAVNGRLQKLVSDQFCSEEEMNEKVKSKIRMLSERDALFAIDELASVERHQIRNFGSYFMGILNRYMRGETGPKQGNKRNRDGRAPGRFDDHRREDRYQRGRDAEPGYRSRDNQYDSYRRERSRERYDQGQRHDQNWRDQYDPRQAKPPYQGQYQQPPMGAIPGNPPPPPPRAPGVLGGYQQPMQTSQPPNQQYAQQATIPPPFVPQPPPQSSAYGNLSNSQPYPPRGNAMTGHQPPRQYNPSVSQSPYANSQGGMGVAQGMGGNQNSYGSSVSQPMPPMMGQQSSYGNPQQTPPNIQGNNRFSQPQQQGSRWQPQAQGMYQNPPGQTPPVDILGLADKAASAVQALQSQSNLQIPPAPVQNAYQPGPPGYQAPPAPHRLPQVPMQQSFPSVNPPQSMAPGQNRMGGRRRTTATMAELHITVQYAVQNLQATGQIDGPLDEGMLGMVKDLPEELALATLQKFSSIDKNTMRNKTAYLAGVLRRELEKINRR